MVPTWTGNLKKRQSIFQSENFDQTGESEKMLGKSGKFVKQKSRIHGNMA